MQVTSKNRYPFDPRNIPGCTLWLDAADSSTITGNPVTSWRDKSASGSNAVSATGPAVSTYNGYPVLSFNGTTHFLSTSHTVLTDTHCLVAVYRPATITGSFTGNTSLFRYQTTLGNYIIFPYMQSTTRRGYISAFDGTGVGSTDATNSTLVENAVTTALNVVVANISSGSQVIYKNGTRQSSLTQALSSTTSQTLVIGKFVYNNLEYYRGDIGEMIVYNRRLSELERQNVEGYLAWKWGVGSLLSTTSPYFARQPYFRTFNPLDVSGCRLWLDGADAGTMFINTSGTAVSSNGQAIAVWRDKSGTFNHASQATSNNRPTAVSNAQNGNWAVNFAGSTTPIFFSLSPALLPTGANPATYLFVTYTGSTSTGVVYMLGSNSSGRAEQIYYTGATATLNADINGTGIIADTTSNLSNYVMGAISFSATTINAWRNGTAWTGTPPAITLNVATNFAYIGTQTGGSVNNFNGRIGEFIAYDRLLSPNERQAIEGYLGWKWGLNSSLTGHPFRTLTSPAPAFSPANISGCQLWLDGADASYMTFSGTNIQTWKDKSGNARDASGNTVGRAAYSTTNTVNGSMAPYFASNASYFIPTFVATSTGNASVFLVATQNGAPPGNIPIFSTSNVTDLNIYATNTTNYPLGYTTGNSSITTAFNTTGGSPFLVSLTITNNVPPSTRNMYVNGSLYSTTTVASNGLTVTLPYTLSLASGHSGYICEIVMFNTVLSTADRQRVEGYLAQKWGMLANLSAGHPYQRTSV